MCLGSDEGASMLTAERGEAKFFARPKRVGGRRDEEEIERKERL